MRFYRGNGADLLYIKALREITLFFIYLRGFHEEERGDVRRWKAFRE